MGLSLHTGVVVFNQDPYKRGRVQVRIFELHGVPTVLRDRNIEKNYDEVIEDDYVTDEFLPWARVMSPMGGGVYDSGSVTPLPVGSTVVVGLEMDDEESIIVLGALNKKPSEIMGYGADEDGDMGKWSAPEGEESELPEEARKEDRKTYVIYKTPKGAAIIVEEADEGEKTRVIDRAGQVIEMFSPVKTASNQGNSKQRGVGNSIDGGQVPYEDILNSEAWIKIVDLSGQSIHMYAKEGESYIELTDKAGQKIKMGATDGAEFIEITDKSGQSIKLDAVANKVEIISKGEMGLDVPSKLAFPKPLTVEITGTASITATGNLTVTAPTILLN